jgi:ubiquinone/menaquinone biosynthesis C-methylase UbiE
VRLVSSYVYDQAWQHERARLQGIETMFDAITRDQLLAAGLAPGWRCLEVGLGAGSIARWMATVVAPEGRVVATDLDPRFLEAGPSLEVRRHDIAVDDLETDAFDLVHARMVLEHVAERERALAKMVAATRPGGWVVVEDVDLGGPMVPALARYQPVPELVQIYERIVRGFDMFMTAAGADTQFGSRLPATMEAAGLTNVYAESRARLLRSAEGDFGRLSVEQLREPLVAAGLVTAEEVETFLAAASEPDASAMSIFLVSARGQRPPAAA